MASKTRQLLTHSSMLADVGTKPFAKPPSSILNSDKLSAEPSLVTIGCKTKGVNQSICKGDCPNSPEDVATSRVVNDGRDFIRVL